MDALEILRLQAIERAAQLDPAFAAKVAAERAEFVAMQERQAALEAKKREPKVLGEEEQRWVSLAQQIQNRSRCNDGEVREATVKKIQGVDNG